MSETFDMAAARERDANAALEYCNRLLFHRHRGILDLDDKFVIFENGRYDNSAAIGEEINRQLASRGYRFAFASDNEEETGRYGCFWAAVVYNYDRSIAIYSVAELVDEATRTVKGVAQ